MSNDWDQNDRGNRDSNFGNQYNSNRAGSPYAGSSSSQDRPNYQQQQQQYKTANRQTENNTHSNQEYRTNPYSEHSSRPLNREQVSPRDYQNRDYGQDYSQDSSLNRNTDHDATFRSGADYGQFGKRDWDTFSHNDDRFAGGFGGRTHGATRETSGGRTLPGFGGQMNSQAPNSSWGGGQRNSGEFATPSGHWSYPSNAKMHAGDMNYGSQNYSSQNGALGGDPMNNDMRGAGFNRDSQNQTGSSYVNHAGRGPKNWKRSDERIKEDVSETLERHTEIDASEIEVNVKDGVVILTGAVEHRLTKRAAEDVCAEVSGVKDVRNELTVNQGLFDQARELLTGEVVRSTNTSTTTGSRATTGRTPRH